VFESRECDVVPFRRDFRTGVEFRQVVGLSAVLAGIHVARELDRPWVPRALRYGRSDGFVGV